MALRADDPRFAACFQIRLEVFVQEQKVPIEEERDEHDARAWHFLALIGGQPAGTARVILLDAQTAKITRVAVPAASRNQGIGAALMRAIEAAAPLAHVTGFVLDAQVTALEFYRRLGFAPQSEIFMEAGMAHRRMSKSRAGATAAPA